MGKIVIDARLIAMDVLENDEEYKEVILSPSESEELNRLTENNIHVGRSETYNQIEEYVYVVVNSFLKTHGWKLVGGIWTKPSNEIDANRKAELLDNALEYVSEHCNGGELINALVDIIGIKRNELEALGFHFEDDVWKEYEEI